jgi:hypothetical protein
MMEAGILTDSCHLEKHMFRVETVNDLDCKWCQAKDERASYVLCVKPLLFRDLAASGCVLWNPVTRQRPG